MDVDAVSSKPAFTNSVQDPSPESEAYLRLLIIYRLLSSPATYGKALELAQTTVEKIQALNRRTMDPISAKVWYAVERAFELGASLADARPLVLLLHFVVYLANRIDLDSFCLLSGLLRCDTITRLRHLSLSAFCATISTTTCTTKRINWYRRRRSRRLPAILSWLDTTITLGESRPFSSTTAMPIPTYNKPSDAHLRQRLPPAFTRLSTNFLSLLNSLWATSPKEVSSGIQCSKKPSAHTSRS